MWDFISCYVSIIWVGLFAKDYITKMEDGVFVSYLMLHICGCGKLCRKKNTPITLLVLELDKQLVFCVSGFHFMYDLFFFFYIFIMPALLVRCSERRSGGCWVVIATVKQANAYQ